MSEPTEADLDLLARLPIFGGLPDAQLSTIYRRAERQSVAADTALVKEGDLGDALFVILEGQVDVLIDTEEETVEPVAQLVP